jgi:hypothetical protein
MISPFNPRRLMLGAAKKFLLDAVEKEPARAPERTSPEEDLPRLTPRAIEKTRMPRSRERILANLDEMYREAFERAKASGDDSQMVSLDFAYRREQLYFEILLDVRDAIDRSR